MNASIILDIFRRKNYYIHTEEYRLNPIAIRASKPEYGFNDLFGFIYMDNGAWKIELFSACTDASVFFENNPINKIGVNIIISGQYLGVMKIGHHSQEYELLRQVKPITFGLSIDKTKIYANKNIKTNDEISFSNVVKSNENIIKKYINKYVQGQIIIQNQNDFDRMKYLVKRHADMYSSIFDFTLISENEF